MIWATILKTPENPSYLWLSQFVIFQVRKCEREGTKTLPPALVSVIVSTLFHRQFTFHSIFPHIIFIRYFELVRFRWFWKIISIGKPAFWNSNFHCEFLLKFFLKKILFGLLFSLYFCVFFSVFKEPREKNLIVWKTVVIWCTIRE